MMKVIVAIRDVKAGLFMQPFFVPAVGVAVRNVQDEVRRVADDNMLNKHPEDFELYELGTWDEEIGYLVQGEGWPKLLCNVGTLVSE